MEKPRTQQEARRRAVIKQIVTAASELLDARGAANHEAHTKFQAGPLYLLRYEWGSKESGINIYRRLGNRWQPVLRYDDFEERHKVEQTFLIHGRLRGKADPQAMNIEWVSTLFRLHSEVVSGESDEDEEELLKVCSECGLEAHPGYKTCWRCGASHDEGVEKKESS